MLGPVTLDYQDGGWPLPQEETQIWCLVWEILGRKQDGV
jgi:hypothetical protein